MIAKRNQPFSQMLTQYLHENALYYTVLSPDCQASSNSCVQLSLISSRNDFTIELVTDLVEQGNISSLLA